MSAVISAFVEGQVITSAYQSVENYLNLIPQGMLDTIAIDATLEESHSSALEITHHPIESGADITDHSYVRPVEVTLRCGWSNSSAQALTQALTQTVSNIQTSGIASLLSDNTGPYAGYVNGIYSQLTALQGGRSPFSIVTTLRSYDNMLIRSIRVERDYKTSNALIASIQCEQVLLVSTSSSTVPPTSVQLSPIDTADISDIGGINPVACTAPPGGALPIPAQYVPVQIEN